MVNFITFYLGTKEFKMDWRLILLWVFVAACIIAMFPLAHKTYTLGSKSEHYQEVCINGHVYYRANFAAKMGIAPKFDDSGKPCKCQ